METGSPGETGQAGHVTDREQADQSHEEVGSPLAAEEESQYPSTQQLFGADSSYVQNLT